MALIEAMSRGVPCLSSDCETGPADIVEPGRNGWLFPVGDVAALTERLQRLMDDPSRLPPREAVAASVQRFSREAVTVRIREPLLALAERRRGSRHQRSSDAATTVPAPVTLAPK